MLKLSTITKVWYTCMVEGEDEQKILDYVKENDVSLEEAVMYLQGNGEIELYKHSIESDFSTEEIENVEEE